NNETFRVKNYNSKTNLSLDEVVKEKTTEVRLIKNLILRKNEEKTIRVRINRSVLDSNCRIFVSPTRELLSGPLELIPGFISKSQNEIKILNKSDIDVKIAKDVIIGYASTNIFQVLTVDIDADEDMFLPS